MDHSQLAALVADTESDRVERKASLTDKDKVCEAICAFANDLPDHRASGLLFVGINDDGSPSGLKITDQLLQDLGSLRSNGNIHPFPSMTVSKETILSAEVAVVEVLPSDMPPVRFKGRTWIRVGPRRDIATPEEERRLIEKRRAHDLPFDLFPLPSASTTDLDLELFRRTYLPAALPPDILEQNQRTTEQQLASLRFLSANQDVTALGIVTLGLEPTRYVPGDYIQFLRIAGTTLTDPIKDQKEISGPLPDLLHVLEETLKVNLSVATDVISQPLEMMHPDYPLSALEQLARNAILHRNYQGTNAPVRITWFDDRVEIQSPGGPFGQVDAANFGRPGVTDYRNPNLAEVMKTLGWVQRFGVGIQIAERELSRNGNPPLEFVIEPNYVLAIVHGSP